MSVSSRFRTAGFLEAFRLGGAGVSALVGAGGKSTFLKRFAAELRKGGDSGLISVTTKLKLSQQELGDSLIQLDWDDSLPDFADYRRQVPLLIRRPLPERNKLDGVAPELICRIHSQNPMLPILVEADGAAEALLKAPGEHEPQIPGCARTVIALSAFPVLGRRLDQSMVHRWEEFIKLCGGDGEDTGVIFSPETAARLLADPAGSFKGVPRAAKRIWFINQADTEEERREAVAFVDALRASPVSSSKRPVCDTIVVGSLERDEFIYIDHPQSREQ